MKLLFCRPRGKVDLTIDKICAPADSREESGDAETDQKGGPGCPGTAWGNDHFVQQGWINDRLPDETPRTNRAQSFPKKTNRRTTRTVHTHISPPAAL